MSAQDQLLRDRLRQRRTGPARLRLGHTVATPGAIEALTEHGVNSLSLVHRHARGDWGDVDAHDAAANDRAVTEGTRVLSAYETAAGRIWVITEADRSSTTVLLPSEY